MSKRTEDLSNQYIGHPFEPDEDAAITMARGAYRQGYEQAEKDIALSAKDIECIVDIYDECLSLTFEDGKPAYESDEFYAEVLRRFNTQREKK